VASESNFLRVSDSEEHQVQLVFFRVCISVGRRLLEVTDQIANKFNVNEIMSSVVFFRGNQVEVCSVRLVGGLVHLWTTATFPLWSTRSWVCGDSQTIKQIYEHVFLEDFPGYQREISGFVYCDLNLRFEFHFSCILFVSAPIGDGVTEVVLLSIDIIQMIFACETQKKHNCLCSCLLIVLSLSVDALNRITNSQVVTICPVLRHNHFPRYLTSIQN
jgi:hypothetical protein